MRRGATGTPCAAPARGQAGVRRSLLYFALVFGTGCVLGPIRVLWLVPRLGERLAEALEWPFMLLAIFLSARFVVARYPATRASAQLRTGGFALALLLACEFGVVLGLRGLTLREYLASRDPVAGALYLVALVLFALMPWLVARRRPAAPRKREH